jgi:hypothetical protein
VFHHVLNLLVIPEVLHIFIVLLLKLLILAQRILRRQLISIIAGVLNRLRNLYFLTIRYLLLLIQGPLVGTVGRLAKLELFLVIVKYEIPPAGVRCVLILRPPQERLASVGVI